MFSLGDKVSIKISGEKGEVIGLAQFVDANSQCHVEYKAADGRAVKEWFYERELTKPKPAPKKKK